MTDLFPGSMPADAGKQLWSDGLERVRLLTGLPSSKARDFLGKLKSHAGDDAAGLHAAIRECPEGGAAAAWLVAAAKRVGSEHRAPAKGPPLGSPPEAWAAFDGGAYEIWGAAEQVCQAARIPDPAWRGDWATLDGWLCDGLDLHAVILPAIKRVAGRHGYTAPSALRFFDGAVRNRSHAA